MGEARPMQVLRLARADKVQVRILHLLQFIKPMTLHEYAVMHGSDKGKYHKYCDFYEARIGEPKSIIEFGVLNGSSLKMWRDRYPEALVVGYDIMPSLTVEGCYTFQISATDPQSCKRSDVDLIIDDASHYTKDQIAAFNIHWPFVNPGGHYIIEDVHTMHYDEYNPDKINFKAWVKSLGIKHEWYWKNPGDESDSGTLIFYK